MKEEVAVVKYDTIPIKALPSDIALTNQKIHLGIYLEGLLSLNGEVSTKRLAVLLTMVHTLVGNLCLKDVKDAFLMYIEGKLPIEPKTNYLDVILFSKVIKEYKIQRRVKIVIKEKEMTQEDKDMNELLSAVICFDYYIQNGILNDSSLYLYKVLLDKFKFSKNEEESMVEASRSSDESIEKQRINYKAMCLRRYFDRLYAKGQHIKDII